MPALLLSLLLESIGSAFERVVREEVLYQVHKLTWRRCRCDIVLGRGGLGALLAHVVGGRIGWIKRVVGE